MITIQNADSALKDYYLDAVSAQLNDGISPFFSAIEKNTDNVYGKDVKLAVVRGFSGNVMAGAVVDILEYGEKLVAVRKFGLTVLSMYGSPENFSVGVDGGCAEIYRNTAKAVGGKLLFFTSAGLRSFDGSVISEVEHGHSRDISKPVCAAAFDGKYYLSCFSKSLNSDVVFCYSPQDGASWLTDVKADALCAADGVYAFNALGAYRLEEGGEYSFTKKLDFGSDARKTLDKVFIGGTAVVEISNGIYSRKFAGANGTVRPRMRGRSFTVTVKGSQPVYKLTATAEECNAV